MRQEKTQTWGSRRGDLSALLHFGRVWQSLGPSLFDSHSSPHRPKGLSHPSPALPPARRESLESGGAFFPSSPLWMGRQARGPSGAGRGLDGRWAWKGPHLSSA